jgi:hypothetical protein
LACSAKAVAQITCHDGALATGSLIFNDLFVTDHHTLANPAAAEGAIVEFDYAEQQGINSMRFCEPATSARFRYLRRAAQGTVRPMLILIGLVLAQDLPQMALIPDEGAVQELAAAAADPAFGDRAGPHRQLRPVRDCNFNGVTREAEETPVMT